MAAGVAAEAATVVNAIMGTESGLFHRHPD